MNILTDWQNKTLTKHKKTKSNNTHRHSIAIITRQSQIIHTDTLSLQNTKRQNQIIHTDTLSFGISIKPYREYQDI